MRITSLVLAKHMCHVEHEDHVCSFSHSSIGVLTSVADQRQMIRQPGAVGDPRRNDSHDLAPITSDELFQKVPMSSRYTTNEGSSPFRRNRSDSKQLQNATQGGTFQGTHRISNSELCVTGVRSQPVAFMMFRMPTITALVALETERMDTQIKEMETGGP